ncbi:MAG: hypothetical protein LBD68_08290 [Zoogloeaceae bacterium]|jgi:hypothetical protein|nr:hypothetical protein [Zoogloeaceae bacterium]
MFVKSATTFGRGDYELAPMDGHPLDPRGNPREAAIDEIEASLWDGHVMNIAAISEAIAETPSIARDYAAYIDGVSGGITGEEFAARIVAAVGSYWTKTYRRQAEDMWEEASC